MNKKVRVLSQWLHGAMDRVRKPAATYSRRRGLVDKRREEPSQRNQPGSCSRRVLLALPTLLLTGCPDVKLPKDPRRLPMPKSTAIDKPAPTPQDSAAQDLQGQHPAILGAEPAADASGP